MTQHTSSTLNSEHATHVIGGVDVSSRQFIADPFPTYQKLLHEAPIYQDPSTGDFYISRPEDIQVILKDNKTYSSDRASSFASMLSPEQHQAVKPLIESMSRWLLFQDPPKHMPLRKIVNASLNHKLISKMESDIRRLTRMLVEEMKASGETDLIQGIAYPLPALVIAHLLEVPERDIHLIRKWSNSVAAFMGGKAGPQGALSAQTSIVDMTQYLRPFLETVKHHSSPAESENLWENLRQYQLEHPDFTDDDIIANCILLLFAGHETTTHLIANLWYRLHQFPEQLNLLIQQPELIPNAVEEGLRFDGSVHRFGRMTTQDTEIAGVLIPKGTKVFLMIGAAHRSASLYENPDDFDVRRQGIRHMGFGFGPHLCSGAALGRLEAAIAIEALLNAFPNSQLSGQPEYQDNLGIRAMKSLQFTHG